MTKSFIKQQQELADKLYYNDTLAVRLEEVVERIITNTGEELLRLAYEVDVEKTPTIEEEAWANQFDNKAEAFWYGEKEGVDNIKKEITNITGVKYV